MVAVVGWGHVPALSTSIFSFSWMELVLEPLRSSVTMGSMVGRRRTSVWTWDSWPKGSCTPRAVRDKAPLPEQYRCPRP